MKMAPRIANVFADTCLIFGVSVTLHHHAAYWVPTQMTG